MVATKRHPYYFSIDKLDSGPVDLEDQLPLLVEYRGEIPGPDGQDYTLVFLPEPVRIKTSVDILRQQGVDPSQIEDFIVTFAPNGWVDLIIGALALAPRFVGGKIGVGMKDFPVSIAYILHTDVMRAHELDFSLCWLVAVGFVTDRGYLDEEQAQACIDKRWKSGSKHGYSYDRIPLTFEGYCERFVEPDGSPHFPPNDGAVPGSRLGCSSAEVVIRDYGKTVDRIGYDNGQRMNFFINNRPATFGERALSLDSMRKPYYTYELTGCLPEGWWFDVSTRAYGFGWDGGAIQFCVVTDNGENASIEKLINRGVLRPL